MKFLLKNKLNVSRWFTGPPLLKVSIKKRFKEELNSACWIKGITVAHGGFSMTSIGISKNLPYNYSPRSVYVLHLLCHELFPARSPHTLSWVTGQLKGHKPWHILFIGRVFHLKFDMVMIVNLDSQERW